MQELELVSFILCPYVQRARIVLLEKGVEHKVTYIDLSDPPDWFYDVSPLEKVPVLLIDGEPVFESMVIVEYLDELTSGSMHPEDILQKAKNRSWIEFGNQLLGLAYTLLTTSDEKEYKRTLATLDDRFDILEDDVLNDSTYFNGEAFSIVDAVYAPLFRMLQAMNSHVDLGLFDDREKVTNWKNNLLQRESVVNCVPAEFKERYEAYMKKQDSIFSAKI